MRARSRVPSPSIKGTRREPRTFTQLGASASGDAEALTILMRSAIGDYTHGAYVAIAGASRTEARKLVREIAVRVMGGTGVNGPFLRSIANESPSDSICMAVSAQDRVIGVSKGGAGIYIADGPGSRVRGPYETFETPSEFAGYLYLVDSRLDQEELEELRRISEERIYPGLIAEEYVVENRRREIAMAILGVKLPFFPTPYLGELRLNSAFSHRGMSRANNEDSVLASSINYSLQGTARSLSILIVADGAGGHSYGDAASRGAVIATYGILLESIGLETPLNALEKGVHMANDRVLKLREETRSNAATTLTAALVEQGRVHAAHCGDSRMYLVGERISRLTEDHKYVTDLIKQGLITEREARSHPQRHVITSALGMEKPRVDLLEKPLKGDEVVLLCTDGLTDVVEDWEIQSYVLLYRYPTVISPALIDLANARGGPDNISIALSVPGSLIFVP